MRGVPKKFAHEKRAPLGSAWSTSEIPTSIPWSFFTGHAIALFGPPSVPRSNAAVPRQSVACVVWSPGTFEKPPAQLRLSMLIPPLVVPPSAPRFSTV